MNTPEQHENDERRSGRGRAGRAKRPIAALGAAFLIAASMGSGPVVAIATAQSSSVLQQSAGGAAPSGATARAKAGSSSGTAADLNAPPDFSGPGVDKGLSLVGWAKAGALIIGTLTLTIGVPLSKALKEAGNHHASGVRAGAMGVGGSMLLVGIAGTTLPWLMG